MVENISTIHHELIHAYQDIKKDKQGNVLSKIYEISDWLYIEYRGEKGKLAWNNIEKAHTHNAYISYLLNPYEVITHNQEIKLQEKINRQILNQNSTLNIVPIAKPR